MSIESIEQVFARIADVQARAASLGAVFAVAPGVPVFADVLAGARATPSPPGRTSASMGMPKSDAWMQALPERGRAWAPAIRDAAIRHGVDPRLLASLVWAESGFRADATSHAGAIGLAQLMPSTAAGMRVDPHDPLQNIEGGAKYLRLQLDRFGSVDLALAAYNAGPGRVRRAGGIPNIPETQRYVARVLDNYAKLQGADSAPPVATLRVSPSFVAASAPRRVEREADAIPLPPLAAGDSLPGGATAPVTAGDAQPLPVAEAAPIVGIAAAEPVVGPARTEPMRAESHAVHGVRSAPPVAAEAITPADVEPAEAPSVIEPVAEPIDSPAPATPTAAREAGAGPVARDASGGGDAILAAATRRVMEAVDRFEAVASSRGVAVELVELGELTGVRLGVEVRGSTVHLRVLGGEAPPQMLDALMRDVASGLDARGFELAGDGRRRHAAPERPEPMDHVPPPVMRARASAGVRL